MKQYLNKGCLAVYADSKQDLGYKSLNTKVFVFLLKIRLPCSQQVKIHWDIVLLEILGCRGLAYLSRLLHILGKCIQV